MPVQHHRESVDCVGAVDSVISIMIALSPSRTVKSAPKHAGPSVRFATAEVSTPRQWIHVPRRACRGFFDSPRLFGPLGRTCVGFLRRALSDLNSCRILSASQDIGRVDERIASVGGDALVGYMGRRRLGCASGI